MLDAGWITHVVFLNRCTWLKLMEILIFFIIKNSLRYSNKNIKIGVLNSALLTIHNYTHTHISGQRELRFGISISRHLD